MTRLRLALAAIWLALVPAAAAEPDLAVAAVVVARNHVSRPPVAAMPTDSVAAFDRWLRTLDPHSRYLPGARRSAPQGEPESLVGLGALVTDTPDGPLLVPLQNGPAYRAGLRHPLLVRAVDAQPVAAAEDLRRAVAHRSSLSLSGRDLVDRIERGYELRPAAFPVPPLELMRVAGQRLVRLHLFLRGQTARRLREALASAGSRVVLDLRYAGGGDLLEAVDAASLLLQPGAVVATTRDGDGTEVTFRNRRPCPVTEAEVVLLIGPQTASAAELFARGLVVNGRAWAAGQPTRGKCTVQRRFPLPNGDVLELSVATMIDPHGAGCGGKGLAPDRPFAGNIHDTEALLAIVRTTRK